MLKRSLQAIFVAALGVSTNLSAQGMEMPMPTPIYREFPRQYPVYRYPAVAPEAIGENRIKLPVEIENFVVSSDQLPDGFRPNARLPRYKPIELQNFIDDAESPKPKQPPDELFSRIDPIETTGTLNTIPASSLSARDLDAFNHLLDSNGNSEKAIRTCSNSVKRLVNLIPSFASIRSNCLTVNQGGIIVSPASSEDEDKVLHCIEKIHGYVQHCMSSGATGSGVSEDERRTYSMGLWVTGIIYWASEKSITCSATLITDDKILTSRHCFRFEKDGKLQQVALEEFRFYPYSDLDYDFEKVGRSLTSFDTGLESTARYSDLSDLNDYVIVNLKSPFYKAWSIRDLDQAHTRYSFQFAEPQRFARSAVIGFQRYSALIGALETYKKYGSLIDDEYLINSGDWKKHVRFDSLPTCMIGFQNSNNRCLLHGCQTEGGTSGAPLFVIEDDGTTGVSRLNLAGIHTRAIYSSNDRGGDCDSVAGSGVGNLAISPSQNDRKFLNRLIQSN